MTESDNGELHGRSSTLRPEITHILDLVGLSQHIPDLRRIAERLVVDDTSAIADLTAIDRTIPGLGFVDVNELNSNGSVTGVYQIADRAIFRGIQYVGAHLSTGNIEWLTRSLVTESCYHLEHSLKRRLGIREDENLSVGMILSTPGGRRIHGTLRKPLVILNRAVYNRAKHTIELVDIDSHMFSVADAFAVYLSCRAMGSELIRELGLKTKYGVPIFSEVGSVPED